tara:strand:+ start:64703 stop:64930 length:228 start_codon:yes stop_codon:yes gene_type:complete
VGFKVEKLLSGPMGVDAQIATPLADGKINIVIFFRDLLDKHPHEPCYFMLMYSCEVHNLPLATNPAAAGMFMKAI